MPTFVSRPKLLNFSLEPANGTIVTTATAPFDGAHGLITQASGYGVIAKGEILTEDGSGPYVFPATPEGTGLKIAAIFDSWRDGRIVVESSDHDHLGKPIQRGPRYLPRAT